MSALAALAGLALIHLAAAATPGPNTLLVGWLAASRSRRAGLVAAAGVVAASFLWAGLSLAGIGALMLGFGLRLAAEAAFGGGR